MTKLLDCPVCNKKGVPVRNDAKVCSPSCRVKQWRKAKRNCMIVEGVVYCEVSKKVKVI